MAMPKTETCAIYNGGATTDTNTLNVYPNAQTLTKAGVAVNIHRGTTDAIAQATALGLNSQFVALAYFNTDSLTYLKVHSIILDKDGVCWIVRDTPAKRDRFPATAHVRCLLLGLNVRPDGLPAETS